MKKKKLTILLLIALSCLALVACGTSKEAEEADQKTIEVDENILTVDITLPSSMFEGEDMSDFDSQEYAAENGFKKAILNDDGSITVTMTKAKHRGIMAEMEDSLGASFQELIDETPYIEAINGGKGYKTVTVEVDRVGYEAEFLDMTPLSIGMQVMVYQAFAGIEPHCQVIMKDGTDGQVIRDITYPDVLEDKENTIQN